MDDQVRTSLSIGAMALLIVGVLGAGATGVFVPPGTSTEGVPGGGSNNFSTGDIQLETFESDASFASYFEASAQRNGGFGTLRTSQDVAVAAEVADMEDGGSDGFDAPADSEDADGTTRYSETNVQVLGLDEPDVLKTDGESIYYAGLRFERSAGETSVLSLDDPANPEVVAVIPATGELLLVQSADMLLVFDHDRIWGYDVSDPDQPQQVWEERYDAHLQTARLHDGSLYLVLVDRPDWGADPCPITPFGSDPIACTDVFRPAQQIDADAVYTAARVDPVTGAMEDSTSVVGSVRNSATYVSPDAIYLSYTRSTPEYELMTTYLTGPGADHLDAETVARIEALDDLEISTRAKSVELQVIMEEWIGSLDGDDRDEKLEALQEGVTSYVEEHKRAMTTTGIVRVAIDGDLEVTATGEVPGYPLNQWSMDEHEDHLRIATTIPGVHGADAENDVYVLDSELAITGEITGLGETERIYAVRFEGDEGYVVTFRQIDPFYTLDLSDPSNPVMEGELKIPGFSTYLHPLDDEGDIMLGVGQQDRQVKLSIFDVSDRENPDELHAEVLENEHFSEVNRNHRAFLHDARHGVFFLPAGEFSYVFSYENGTLTEEARVNIGGPDVRAMYVDDYLYVLGSGEVVVLDQTTWEVVTRVDAR